MTVPVRFDQMPPQRQQAIQANLAKMHAAKAPDDDVETYLRDVEHVAPAGQEEAPQRPGILSRVGTQLGGMVKQAVTHPIDTAESLITAPIKSAVTALSPGVGENRPSAALSKGGNSSGRPIDTSPYDAAHGGVTPAQRTAGGAQTVANLMFPGVAKGVAGAAGGGALAKMLGMSTAGAPVGAAYSPDDPMAGALTGAVMGPALHGAGKVLKGVGGAVGDVAAGVGGKIVDVAGRPDVSRPVVKGVPLGSIEGVADRAARQNSEGMQRGGVTIAPPTSGKPMAPVDLGGIPAQRMARGLKTSSPAAETVMRDALEPRADNAVSRVIDHGLETTGLKNRESGIQTAQDLHDKAQAEGAVAYGQTFSGKPHPIADEGLLGRMNDILETPAGRDALQRGQKIAANQRQPFGPIAKPTGGTPPGYQPDQWAEIVKTMEERGIQPPNIPSTDTRIAPTLKQAHFIKLGFDDYLNSAPEPGTGGSGPHNAAAVRGLKNDWLGAMDEHSPEYQSSRKQYADTKQLEDAATLGQQLFKMHPDQMKIEMQQMPTDAQNVLRRSGFNALAERIENGPADISKGLKVLDRKRMRLLFPDDASFGKFQDGLKEEAQMHATNKTILTGSATADKLSDMADMAGVTLPEILQAASGKWPSAIKGVLTRHVNAMGGQSVDRVAVERAKLLTAGADGDATARAAAIAKMQPKVIAPPRSPLTPPPAIPQRDP